MATKTRTITRYRAPKRRTHRRAKFGIPLAVVAGFTPLGYAMYRGFTSSDSNYGGLSGALREGAQQFGIDPAVSSKVDFGQTLKGLTPIVAGLLIHKFVGGTLGVNRALAAAGTPVPNAHNSFFVSADGGAEDVWDLFYDLAAGPATTWSWATALPAGSDPAPCRCCTTGSETRC